MLSGSFRGFALSAILTACANTHITNSVWSSVAKTCHAILVRSLAALIPFSALFPDRQPFLEAKKERNFSLLCRSFLRMIHGSMRIFFFPFKSSCAVLLSVCRPASATIGIVFFSIGGIPDLKICLPVSHWLLRTGTMVRSGIDAATSVPFRALYTINTRLASAGIP